MLQWTHLTHQVIPSHLRAVTAQHSGLTPQVNSLLKTLAESLQTMDYPSPLELGVRSPGTRDQLSGKCIFSTGVDSRPATLPALGGATAVLADVLQLSSTPDFRVSARDPHCHHPTQLGERESVMPLPTVWAPPASGHAEYLYSTRWHLSPHHQLQPMTNDSRRLS